MKPYAPPTLSSLVTLPKPARPAAVTRQPKMARSMKPSSSPISRLGTFAHPPKGGK
jgi:hypothetical protein